MDINSIIDNIVLSISGDSDYKTWINGIWARVGLGVEKVDSETAALELPASDILPDSRVFSLPQDIDHEGQDEIYGFVPVSIITWLNEKIGRDLADDLRSAQNYIIKAIMSDDFRGGHAIFTEVVFAEDPNTESDPLGYIRLDVRVYYQIKEAS